jgi:hypothetical protein
LFIGFLVPFSRVIDWLVRMVGHPPPPIKVGQPMQGVAVPIACA